ncbi:MAG: response regulator, partial [Gemmatimonadetes bacterium]|nr:response regulator [Gemmatimonadota bacterium]
LEHYEGLVHLLVTDVVMPGMGGLTLAQRLDQTRPGMKVLYMSGYTDDVVVRHGVLDEGTSFLGKPFTVVELTRKVREVLDSES